MPLTKVVNGVEVTLTAQEEQELLAERVNWENTVKPHLLRSAQFKRAKRAALSFDPEEADILLAGYFEVKLLRMAILLGQTPASVDTPVLDVMNVVFPEKSKLQIAQTVENRIQNYLELSATALANKIKNSL